MFLARLHTQTHILQWTAETVTEQDWMWCDICTNTAVLEYTDGEQVKIAQKIHPHPPQSYLPCSSTSFSISSLRDFRTSWLAFFSFWSFFTSSSSFCWNSVSSLLVTLTREYNQNTHSSHSDSSHHLEIHYHYNWLWSYLYIDCDHLYFFPQEADFFFVL